MEAAGCLSRLHLNAFPSPRQTSSATSNAPRSPEACIAAGMAHGQGPLHPCQSRQQPQDFRHGNLLGRRKAFASLLLMGTASLCGGNSRPALAAEAKEANLPLERIKEIIEMDIRKGQYYVTGDLTRAIYDENCRFVDPTTDIRGVDKYITAIKLLFDPSSSHHELVSIDVTGPHTIQAKWKLEGYLKVPWHPHILPYGGTTQYTLNKSGLIESHTESWDISVWTAFLEFLTPSWKPL